MEFPTDCLFVGYEIEGHAKGVKTLFVGSHDVPSEAIEEALKDKSIKALYFGAGNNRGISLGHCYLIDLYEKSHTIRLEISNPDDLCILKSYQLYRIEVIFVIPIPAIRKMVNVSAIKLLEPNMLHLAYTDKWYSTSLNDLAYSEDVKI